MIIQLGLHSSNAGRDQGFHSDFSLCRSQCVTLVRRNVAGGCPEVGLWEGKGA